MGKNDSTMTDVEIPVELRQCTLLFFVKSYVGRSAAEFCTSGISIDG